MAMIEPRRVVVGEREVTLRTATAADGAGVHHAFVVTYGETEFLSRGPDELSTNPDQLASRLASKLSSPTDVFLVAELEGRLIATAALTGSSLRRFDHSAELALAVMKDYWGRGIGRQLVHAMLDWGDAHGLARIFLEVSDSNARAIRLYEHFGFEVEGRLRARRKQGNAFTDNLLMARVRLPPRATEA